MHERAVHVVHHVRATWTAFLPVRAEHEVINDELAFPAEQIGKLLFSGRSIKHVILVDLFPRQFAAQPAQLIAQPAKLLLLDQQLFASHRPFRRRNHFRESCFARCHCSFSFVQTPRYETFWRAGAETFLRPARLARLSKWRSRRRLQRSKCKRGTFSDPPHLLPRTNYFFVDLQLWPSARARALSSM